MIAGDQGFERGGLSTLASGDQPFLIFRGSVHVHRVFQSRDRGRREVTYSTEPEGPAYDGRQFATIRMPDSRHPPLSADAAAAVTRVGGAFDAFCAAERLPADVAWRLRVALDEIVANIVSHGGVPGSPPQVDVTFRRDGGRVEVVVADDGPAFDPLAKPEPDVTLPLDARQPGGLGIVLIKSLIDDVQYVRTTRNVLTLRTRLRRDADREESGL